jgi:hypothetical protein
MVEGREVEDEVKNGRKLALALLAANAFLMVRVGMKVVEAARGKEWRHEGIFYALDALPVLGELSSSPQAMGCGSILAPQMRILGAEADWIFSGLLDVELLASRIFCGYKVFGMDMLEGGEGER